MASSGVINESFSSEDFTSVQFLTTLIIFVLKISCSPSGFSFAGFLFFNSVNLYLNLIDESYSIDQWKQNYWKSVLLSLVSLKKNIFLFVLKLNLHIGFFLN